MKNSRIEVCEETFYTYDTCKHTTPVGRLSFLHATKKLAGLGTDD